VEAEECLPFTTGVPATSALLALLKPVALDTLVATGQYLSPTVVKGRQSLTDAHYSLITQKHPAELIGIEHTRGAITGRPIPLEIRTSYRAAPSDGQFGRIELETATYDVAFRLNTPWSALESHQQLQRYAGAEVVYFWNLPHTSVDIYSQMVNDAYVPATPNIEQPVPDPGQQFVAMPPAKNAVQTGDPVVKKTLAELRDVLGADYGAIIDQHAEMASLAGKQLPDAAYEAKSRTLTGLLTAFQVDMVPFIVEDVTAAKTFLTWFRLACEDAREWDYRPTSKDQLIQQQALVAGMVEGMSDLPLPPTPPLPPSQEDIREFTQTIPFSEAQPDPEMVAASIELAATGDIQPEGSHKPDFPPSTESQQQAPAHAVAPQTATGLVTGEAAFTAPQSGSPSVH
jgi:hypothetical protein